MNMRMLYACGMLCTLLSIKGAADQFKHNRPLFYAALAEAAYRGHKYSAQDSLNAIVGHNQGTVVAHQEHFSSLFGKTSFIGVKDRFGGLHIGIEGSNSSHNWLGNGLAPLNGYIHKYDVPEATRKEMHKRIKGLAKQHGALISLVGHSQGGMFASQVAASHEDAYRNTQIITFNGYKIKSRKNQLHFAIKNEMAVSLCSPEHRYIFLPYGGGKLAIAPNHGMKHFLNGLKRKEWPDILKKIV